MISVLINTSARVLHDKEWYDPLGTYYEVLASRGKKSSMGQFFTPADLCDMISGLQGTEGMTDKTVSDPCCGSGRLLLSFHAKYPGNFFFAEDLDNICCKMTVINFLTHGVVGEVVHHNSLDPDSYFKGWVINQNLTKHGMISIGDLKKENSFIWNMWQQKKESREVEIKDKPVQLQLF